MNRSVSLCSNIAQRLFITVIHFDILYMSFTLWHILMYLLSLGSSILSAGVHSIKIYNFLLTETLPEIFWYERRQWSGVSWKEYTASSPLCRLCPPCPPPPISAGRRSSTYFSIVTPMSSASLISSSSDTGHRRHIYFPLKIEEKPDKIDKKTLNVYHVVRHDFSGSIERTQGRCPQLLHSCSLALEGPN